MNDSVDDVYARLCLECIICWIENKVVRPFVKRKVNFKWL